VSAHLARAGLRDLLGRRRIAVLPAGVNTDRFARIDRRAARERLGLDPGGRYLLFPADPARPEKRFDRAQRLAEATRTELLTYGNRPPADVPILINAANAVLVTSEREGFGLATLEALACDVPVLSTDVGVAPLALNGIAGTHCDSFDADRWELVLEPHLAAADPRIEGRARAGLFDRNRFAERVFKAYQDVLADG
jgi:glycosyltransferase involved in cell wall biosynthesis